jgi:hypothetical protein
VLLEQRVVDVSARDSLVAREVDRAIDVDRQIGVHLDQAAVRCPDTSCSRSTACPYVLDGEGLVRGKLHVRQRPLAAFRDGAVEHARQPVGGDDELRRNAS